MAENKVTKYQIGDLVLLNPNSYYMEESQYARCLGLVGIVIAKRDDVILYTIGFENFINIYAGIEDLIPYTEASRILYGKGGTVK